MTPPGRSLRKADSRAGPAPLKSQEACHYPGKSNKKRRAAETRDRSLATTKLPHSLTLDLPGKPRDAVHPRAFPQLCPVIGQRGLRGGSPFWIFTNRAPQQKSCGSPGLLGDIVFPRFSQPFPVPLPGSPLWAPDPADLRKWNLSVTAEGGA